MQSKFLGNLLGVAAVFFAIFFFSASAGSAAGGKEIFKGKNCAGCHLTEGPTKGEGGENGPALWYAGSKFREGFLREWLKNPLPIRPIAYGSITEENPGNHPRLLEAEAKEVAAYLMTLKTGKVAGGAARSSDTALLGSAVFEKKGGCYGCHRIKKEETTVGGLSGPSLVDAGKRLNPDWIYAYLKDPGYFSPPRGMPVYRGILEDREMKAAALYLSFQK